MLDPKRRCPARGFTLIELIIAVGVMAILIAFAVPAYKEYTIRSKVAECVNEAAVAKLQISEYRQTLGAWPPNFAEAGLEDAGASHYCIGFTQFESSSGAFEIDVNEATVDPKLTQVAPVMTPYYTLSGLVNWVCSRGSTDEEDIRYLPATCRGS